MDHPWQDFVQYLLGGPAALGLLRRQILTFRRFEDVQLLECETLLFGETVGRARRLADSVIGHRLRRTGHFIHDVCLLFEQATYMRDESAWRAERLDRHTIRKILGRQKLLKIRAEILFGFR